MSILIFTFTLLLLSLAFFTKFVFFGLEPKFLNSFFGVFEISIFTLSSVLFIGFFLKEEFKNAIFSIKKVGIWKKVKFINLLTGVFLTISIIAFVYLSLHLSSIKQSLDWDAVALYDARAKFVLGGLHFSQMGSLALFDDKNQYYYLLYPPFTSILHIYWHNLLPNTLITLLYSSFYILLGLGIFLISLKRLSILMSLLLTLVVLSYRTIFLLSISEYVNMPFILFQVTAIFLLYLSFFQKKNWYLVGGGMLLALTQWIRFLEPVWLMVLISFMICLIVSKEFKKRFKLFGLVALLCLSQYFSWTYFIKSIAVSPDIVKLGFLSYLEMFVGVFTGSFLLVFSYFLNSFGYLSLIYLVSIIPYRMGKEDRGIIFLKLTIFLTLLLYLLGMVVLSMSFSWWKESQGSLERSSVFLLPIAVFVIFTDLRKLYDSNKQIFMKR